MRNYLIVANHTLGGGALEEAVREHAANGPCRFHFVVPASPPMHALTWTEGEARAQATRRLIRALDSLTALGANVSGEVADCSPLLATLDSLRSRHVDEVILCTLPAGLSRWLRQDLPARLRKRVRTPVTHLVCAAEHELVATAQAA